MPNKYILCFESTANGIAAWDLLLQDYGSKNNLDVQKAEIDKELLCVYDPAQKGGVLQYLDDTESAWVQMETLDPHDMLSDEAKIREPLRINCRTPNMLMMLFKLTTTQMEKHLMVFFAFYKKLSNSKNPTISKLIR